MSITHSPAPGTVCYHYDPSLPSMGKIFFRVFAKAAQFSFQELMRQKRRVPDRMAFWKIVRCDFNFYFFTLPNIERRRLLECGI